MNRVERHIIFKDKRLDNLCFLSKNLYNYQSSTGKLLNADVNGAIGIARKVIGDSFIKEIINRGLVFNPVRINVITNFNKGGC